MGGTAIQFAVDHVYANGERGGLAAIDRLEVGTSLLLENLDSPGIDGDGLVISHRYLVSTGALPAFRPGGRYLSISPRDTVVWELVGSTATLVDIYGCANEAPLAAFESASTVAEALALVAPGAGLPPTDTVEPAGIETPLPMMWLALLLGALAGLVYLLRPRLPARP